MRFIIFNKETGRIESVRESGQCATGKDMLDHAFGLGSEQIYGCAPWGLPYDGTKLVDVAKYDAAAMKFTTAKGTDALYEDPAYTAQKALDAAALAAVDAPAP